MLTRIPRSPKSISQASRGLIAAFIFMAARFRVASGDTASALRWKALRNGFELGHQRLVRYAEAGAHQLQGVNRNGTN
jgi:hypothetical protein